MTGDRFLRWCARSYAQLLVVLSVRESRERRAIGDDGERLLTAAHAHGRLTLATTWMALVWDLVFGTFFLPSGREPPERIGLADLPEFPRGYLAQLRAPFRWARLRAGASTPPAG